MRRWHEERVGRDVDWTQWDSSAVEATAALLLAAAGRPMAWDTLEEIEKEAWRYMVRLVLTRYHAACG